jgi:hypothetical protein
MIDVSQGGEMTKRMFVGAAALTALWFGGGALEAQAPQAAPGAPAAQAAPRRGTPPCGPNLADVTNVAKDSRCFELRTYTLREGGSIDTLHSRFRDHTTGLFKKHGITMLGFWQPVTKKDTLIYLLVYKDAAERDAQWAAFGKDPEWQKVLKAMPVNLAVEAVFMSATDYSSVK